jgi:hypothetical protein
MKTAKNYIHFILPLFTLFLCLIPWFIYISQKALNHDVIWFITGAERWLAGQGLEQNFIDPNPPLAFLLYLPVVGLNHGLGLSWESATTLQTLVFIGLSAFAFFILLEKLVDEQNAIFLTLVLIITGTIISFADFAQRDEFIALALAPFLIGQIILTQRISAPRPVLWAVFLCGALVIWLRPHFGLLPVCMLIHRMIVRKRWDIWKDIDFQALAMVSVAYITAVNIFFPSFIHVLLPDLVKLYVPGEKNFILFDGLGFSILYLIWILLSLIVETETPDQARLPVAFLFAAYICLFIYVIQFRIYSYHLLPASMFSWLAGGHILFRFGRQFLSRSTSTLGIILLASTGYMLHPVHDYPTRRQIREFPLTRMVASCGPNCGFFYIGDGRLGPLIPYYAHKAHASRFNGAWFLSALMNQNDLIKAGKPALLTPEQYHRLAERYVGYFVDDMKRYPDSIIMACDKMTDKNNDFIKYMSSFPVFSSAITRYKSHYILVDYSVFLSDISPPYAIKKCIIYQGGN